MPTPDGYISEEDYISWLHHPVTKAVTDARYSTILNIEKFLGSGGTVDAENATATAINTAVNVGYIKGLKEAVNPPDYLYQETPEAYTVEDEDED